MRLTALAALALLAVAACGEAPDPAQTVAVPEADVERFRAEIVRRTLTLDADLARLEAEASAADSAARAAYGPVLDRLRADRRRLQVRLDSLRPAPPAQFDSTRVQVRAQTERLAEAVRGARYAAAPTYDALQAATGRGLAALDARLAALRAAAPPGGTAAVDSLAAERARLTARLAAYPDTLASAFPPFREQITEAVLALERRAEVLAEAAPTAPSDSTDAE